MSNTSQPWLLYGIALIIDLFVLLTIVYLELEIILIIFATIGLFVMLLMDKAFKIDERAQQVSQEASYLAIRIFILTATSTGIILLILGSWAIGSTLVICSVLLIILQTVITIYTDNKYS